MCKDIREKRMQMERRYYKSNKHTFQVDYLSYMDELAEKVGCSVPIIEVIGRSSSIVMAVVVITMCLDPVQ